MVLAKLVDSISGRLAFFPPVPTYTVAEHGDGDRALYCKPLSRAVRKVPQGRVTWVPAAGSSSHQLVVVRVPAPNPTRRTILHSHGNAVDLGEMLPLYASLARVLQCNVVGWDYRGYGCSGGVPAASTINRDVHAVYAALQRDEGLTPGDVVLYGQSVGSGPTCHLAASPAGAGAAGVVLHSPFLSGMRVLNPGWTRWPAWADLFPNHAAAPRIAAPTLVVHGTADSVIPVGHGRTLATLCPAAVEALWVEGADHDNVEDSPLYVPRLKAFLTKCWGD
ncbi:hypothetical protein ACKKBG_A26875 [Auxenochlorella protothecoides x Auxenochlorella symbiontica]|uniref:Serine aminopeptidase S33 domain-containing protein n=1 Tax=Auxenochlorella protothecoides TaxID=3075 RepID=A0A1D2A9C5_AUXPR